MPDLKSINLMVEIDFEISRVKLQRKVSEGKKKSLRISGISSYRGFELLKLNVQ